MGSTGPVPEMPQGPPFRRQCPGAEHGTSAMVGPPMGPPQADNTSDCNKQHGRRYGWWKRNWNSSTPSNSDSTTSEGVKTSTGPPSPDNEMDPRLHHFHSRRHGEEYFRHHPDARADPREGTPGESVPDPRGFAPYRGGYGHFGGYPPFHGHRYGFYRGRYQGGPETTYIFREFDFQ
ncbi:hypothetical protein ACOMHN_016828 [Nucella lapillus]